MFLFCYFLVQHPEISSKEGQFINSVNNKLPGDTEMVKDLTNSLTGLRNSIIVIHPVAHSRLMRKTANMLDI